MVFRVLIIFCLVPPVRKDKGNQKNFHDCYENFLKVPLVTACLKRVLNNYESHWQLYFEKRFWRFYGYG